MRVKESDVKIKIDHGHTNSITRLFERKTRSFARRLNNEIIAQAA
jgi:hypothetical protein